MASGTDVGSSYGDGSSLLLFSSRGCIFALELGCLLEVVVINASDVSLEEGPFKYRFDFRSIRPPVLDLTEAGMTPVSMEGSLQLLVMEVRSLPVALVIDRVLGTVKGKGAVFRFPQILRTKGNGYIKAIFGFEDKIAFVIDPLIVLDEEQVAGLKAIYNSKK